MQYPEFDVAAFLGERTRPASVATVTPQGRPALAMMWFVFVDGRLWFHTPSGSSPFLAAAQDGCDVAAMVATFNPPDVRQVRVTGPARLEDADFRRTRAIYDRYVDEWSDKWERQATSPVYRLWSLLPQRGMAVTYPELEGRDPYYWTCASDMFGPAGSQ